MTQEKNDKQIEKVVLSPEQVLDIEAKQLENDERRWRISEMKRAQADRELADQTKDMKRKQNGQALTSTNAARRKDQNGCTHHTGGFGYAGLKDGDDDLYAVFKHILPTGDMVIRCSRCGKTWYTPQKSEFTDAKTGDFDKAAYDQAVVEYQAAKKFRCQSFTSGAPRFDFWRDGKRINDEKSGEFTRAFQSGL